MTRIRRLFALAAILCALSTALALQPSERLADPTLEARARALSAELRCMVCQNQSIDESDAPLAKDLRLLLRERLQAGDSDEAIKDFLVARYGPFVLLRPPVSWATALLWAGPFAILLLGLCTALLAARRRRAEPSHLSEAEQRALARLLARDASERDSQT